VKINPIRNIIDFRGIYTLQTSTQVKLKTLLVKVLIEKDEEKEEM